MNKKEKILMVAVLLFMATLFFPNFPVLTTISSAFFLITCFFFNSLKEKIQLLKERKFIWWMFGFFVLVLISLFFSDNKHAASRYLDSRLPLLAVPLSMGLIFLRKEARNTILLGIAVLITASCTVCLVWSLNRYVKFQDASLLYNDSFTQLTGQQSIYISVLVNISIYVFSYFLFVRPVKNGNYKILFLLAIIYLFGISYLLASRNMMLVLYLATAIFCCWYILKKRKYLEGATLVMALLLGVFLVFKLFPKTFNRFKELNYTQFNYQSTGPESHYNMAVTADQWNGANFRLAAWRCGWELFLRHPLFGTGIGDKKDRLMEVYRAKNFKFAIQTNKNLHSNYLDILVSMGIIGLLVFFIGWIVLPMSFCWRRRDGLAVVILISFAIAMITEVYFDRSLGGMLFGSFGCLLLVDKRRHENVA